ncbi:ammonium transporter, partial [Pseudomonadota bacterium]
MQNKKINLRWLTAIYLLIFSNLALAEDKINSGDTSWLITATALVLFMTLPGLSLFYAGLVRSKNVLSVLMQCFAITCVASILWVLFVYGLAFGDGAGLQKFIGSFDKAFLSGLEVGTVNGTIPESVFTMFQMTFAIITPALIIGGFA